MEDERKAIPGMSVTYVDQDGKGFSKIEELISATGGLSLSQVCAVSGLEGTTIQNWVKRGWVANPKGKKYALEHVARILIINSLKECIKLEHIAMLMSYLNGSEKDGSGQIIKESELFRCLCDALGILGEAEDLSSAGVRWVAEKTLKFYSFPTHEAYEKIRKALTLMIYACVCTNVKRRTDDMMKQIAKEVKAERSEILAGKSSAHPILKPPATTTERIPYQEPTPTEPTLTAPTPTIPTPTIPTPTVPTPTPPPPREKPTPFIPVAPPPPEKPAPYIPITTPPREKPAPYIPITTQSRDRSSPFFTGTSTPEVKQTPYIPITTPRKNKAPTVPPPPPPPPKAQVEQTAPQAPTQQEPTEPREPRKTIAQALREWDRSNDTSAPQKDEGDKKALFNEVIQKQADIVPEPQQEDSASKPTYFGKN